MKTVLMIVMFVIAMGLVGCPHNRGHDSEHHDRDNDDREHRK